MTAPRFKLKSSSRCQPCPDDIPLVPASAFLLRSTNEATQRIPSACQTKSALSAVQQSRTCTDLGCAILFLAPLFLPTYVPEFSLAACLRLPPCCCGSNVALNRKSPQPPLKPSALFSGKAECVPFVQRSLQSISIIRWNTLSNTCLFSCHTHFTRPSKYPSKL